MGTAVTRRAENRFPRPRGGWEAERGRDPQPPPTPAASHEPEREKAFPTGLRTDPPARQALRMGASVWERGSLARAGLGAAPARVQADRIRRRRLGTVSAALP